MLFNTENVFLFQTGNHNSLILNEVKRFWDSEFTLLLRFKPDRQKCLDNINMGTDHVGCPVAMNGKHIGIFYKINQADEQVVFEWWEVGKKGDDFHSINIPFKLKEQTDYFDVILRRNEDTFTFSVNGVVKQGKTNLLSGDYSHSLLWLGAATMYSKEHSFPFIGEMDKIHIAKSALNNNDVGEFFSDYDLFIEKQQKKLLVNNLFSSSFKKTTYFKILDESGNGNHPILYKDEWLET
mgnify:CR=1 FL=1